MKDRVQVALNKFKKARVKNKTKLSAISDAQGFYEECLELQRQKDSLVDNINNEVMNIVALKENAQADYDEWLELAELYDEANSKLSDALTIIEEKAEELGAAPFEFLPEYNDMTDITYNVGLEDPFNPFVTDILD